MARELEGGDALLAALERNGVRTLFSVSGGPINSAYHASTRQPVRVLHTRHEAAAGYMADAVYRATGRPGGVLVTLGPGVTNVVTPVACAASAGVPMIIVGGQASTRQLHRGAGMEFDTLSVMSQVTKWSAQILHADRIEEFVDEAFRRMMAGTPGPVYLEIPVDVLSARASTSPRQSSPTKAMAPAGISAQSVQGVDAQLRGASRPLVIAGDGVHHSDAADLLNTFVSTVQAPISTLRLARGTVDEEASDWWIGPAYTPANPVLAEALDTADVILLLGHHWEFDLDFGRKVGAGATVIQVHQDAALLGRNGPVDIAICADSAEFLTALTDIDAKERDEKWAQGLAEAWRGLQQELLSRESADESTAHPLQVVDAVVGACPRGTRFVTSHGNVDFWADPRIQVAQPRRYLRVGQSGALGAEIPFGVGSAVEDRGVPSVVFVGDGAVGYHVTELETAAREGVTVVVVVLDDHLWGAIALPQKMDYGVEVAMDLPGRDWALVAEGLGATGRRVDLKALGEAVSDALGRQGPTLLHVDVRSVLSPYMRYISQ